MPNSHSTVDHQIFISIVTYYPHLAELNSTLKSLKMAVDDAYQKHSIKVKIIVVDNSVNTEIAAQISALLQKYFSGTSEIICSVSNVGYGAGHNLASLTAYSQWHLIMNADVELDVDVLSSALSFLKHSDNQAVGLISPQCKTADGKSSYLCKRYPCVLDLALRGFAPEWLKKIFRKRLDNYEYRHETELQQVKKVTIASGCFMFLRGEVWRKIGGFSPDYFLYFEDFDLCMKLNKVSSITYVPDMRIVHHGGNAAGKGLRHVFLFVRSAFYFFSKHGWRFL
ncbi:MAG TPA: glycosyltransferase [Crenotrichaceae bacterium]|nr:glycosyltransferase [Crenotrichaceae bacterium]